MSYDVFCRGCGDRATVNKITAGLRHSCGSDEVEFWEGAPDQRRIAARRDSFALWMGGSVPTVPEDQRNGEGGPGSNEYAGQMPGANDQSNHEGRITCPVCHGSGKDITDTDSSCRECGGDGYITPTTTPESPQVAPHNYHPNTQTKHPYQNLPGDDLRPYVGKRVTSSAGRLKALVARTNPGLRADEVDALVAETMRRYPEVR